MSLLCDLLHTISISRYLLIYCFFWTRQLELQVFIAVCVLEQSVISRCYFKWYDGYNQCKVLRNYN